MGKPAQKRKKGEARGPRKPPAITFFESPAGLQFITALNRRIGETPPERLRWLVQFTERELDRLRPEERVALGYDLRLIAAYSLPRGSEGLNTSLKPMADEELARYQRGVRDGLRAVIGGESWLLPARPYVERVGPADRLSFRDGGEPGGARRFRLSFSGDEHAGILGAVAQLVLDSGDQLWACPECGRPFIAERQQAYCSSRCSQRARNKRRKPRRKG